LKTREKFLVFSDWVDSTVRMIQSGFLSEEDHKALTALARDASSPCRMTRRANALVLLDKGWSCQEVAHAFLLDDDTIRGWRKLFEQRGIEGITSFDPGGVALDESSLIVKREARRVGEAVRRSVHDFGNHRQRAHGPRSAAVRRSRQGPDPPRLLLFRPGLQRTCERISGRGTDWTSAA
jgi:hypothetical protein